MSHPKLSEAIMLGSATCKMVAGDINSCAYGAALNAMGVEKAPVENDMDWFIDGQSRMEAIKQLWPWTYGNSPISISPLAQTIWQKFDDEVCGGKMTLEQLVDYVRTIEPECGECHRFDCLGHASEDVIAESATESIPGLLQPHQL